MGIFHQHPKLVGFSHTSASIRSPVRMPHFYGIILRVHPPRLLNLKSKDSSLTLHNLSPTPKTCGVFPHVCKYTQPCENAPLLRYNFTCTSAQAFKSKI